MSSNFDYSRYIKTLGMKVASKEPFLQETACMDMDTIELIDWTKPLLILRGRARWLKDILTDLGLLLGAPRETEVSLESLIEQ